MKTSCFFHHLKCSLQGDGSKFISVARTFRLETPEHVIFPSLPTYSDFPWFTDRFYRILHLHFFPRLNTHTRTQSRQNWSQVAHTELSLILSGIATGKLLKNPIASNFYWQCSETYIREEFME